MPRFIGVAVVASCVMVGSAEVDGRLKADHSASRATATANTHLWADQEAPASSALRNADIVAMTTAKLSDDVIATSVQRAATTNFDVSPAALIELKNAGVSDRIIQSMQQKAQQQGQTGPGTEPSQSAGVGTPGVGSGSAAACRVFITEDEPPSRSYVVVRKEIQAGKKWYGAHDEGLMRELAAKAEKVGADAIIKFHEWRAPSMFSWAAAKAGGMAVKWTEHGKASVSELKGQCWDPTEPDR